MAGCHKRGKRKNASRTQRSEACPHGRRQIQSLTATVVINDRSGRTNKNNAKGGLNWYLAVDSNSTTDDHSHERHDDEDVDAKDKDGDATIPLALRAVPKGSSGGHEDNGHPKQHELVFANDDDFST